MEGFPLSPRPHSPLQAQSHLVGSDGLLGPKVAGVSREEGVPVTRRGERVVGR